MTILPFIAIFVLFEVSALNFFTSLIGSAKFLWPKIIITVLINLSVILFFAQFLSADTEFIGMILFVSVHFLELALLARKNIFAALFWALIASVNFYTWRVLTLSLTAVLLDVDFAALYEIRELRTLQTVTPFFISWLYIIFAKFLIKPHKIRLMITDKRNVRFATWMFSFTYIFFIATVIFLGADGTGVEYKLHFALLSMLVFIGYHITVFYTLTFVNLKLDRERFDNLRRSINVSESEVERLEEQSNFDAFTGCYMRFFGEKRLTALVDAKAEFNVALVDIDGLKVVNDTFSHTDGDNYIKSVAAILNDVFSDGIVTRMGGDEFLITVEGADKDAVKKLLNVAFAQSLDIAKHLQRDFETSISYGLISVDSANVLSCAEILHKADTKMYKFKENRKVHRQ